MQQFFPSAIAFAVGAQGTKKLGLAGEDARGVYAAKDFVYSYNLLPPFTSHDFSTGKRVAIVGMGNVMVDIARWLLIDAPHKTAEEVVVVARRGRFEAKFDKKEFAYIEDFLDRSAFDEELPAFNRSWPLSARTSASWPERLFRYWRRQRPAIPQAKHACVSASCARRRRSMPKPRAD